MQGRRVDLPSNRKHTWEKGAGVLADKTGWPTNTHYMFFKHAKLISAEVFLSHHSAFIHPFEGLPNSLVHIENTHSKMFQVDFSKIKSLLHLVYHTHNLVKFMKICCVYLVST